MAGHALGGADRLFGGAEDDVLSGDGRMYDQARGGDDRLEGGMGSDALYGDGEDMAGSTQGGDDLLIGGAGDDDDRHYIDISTGLYGDAVVMMEDARGGNDRLFGGMGNDVLFGDGGYIGDNARAGADRLTGGAGNDMLYGDAGTLSGNAGAGEDVLIGGAGDDRLWGDAEALYDDFVGARGRDRFVFARGSGRDTVGDFEHDRDVIDLAAYHGIDDFAQIRAHTSPRGAGVAIDLGAAAGGPGGADVLILADVPLATLDARDFLLA
jgi:Ca2+-binding RTX toxin-like protein